MKKRILLMMLAALLITGMCCTVYAAGDLQNFTQQRTYPQGMFRDVPGGIWYEASVRRAYELGLVEGMGADRFQPAGSITVAQSITLACRLHSIFYTGKAEFAQGAPWYQPYVEYAVRMDIIEPGQYTDMNAAASRYTFASILADALPESALPPVNDVTQIPDVADTPENAAIYRLYRAGILAGNDAYGTFAPQSEIQRSAVAAIVSRMADPSARQHFVLKESQPAEQAYMTRRLSDAELAQLKSADLNTLCRKISSIPDAVAYLDQFDQPFYTANSNNLVLDEAEYFRLAKQDLACPEFYTWLAMRCLSDDYEGIRLLVLAVEENDSFWCTTALAIPCEEGYFICSPANDSAIKNNNNCNMNAVETTTVASLDGLENRLQLTQVGRGSPVYQIFSAPAECTALSFQPADCGFAEVTGNAELLYQISGSALEEVADTKRDQAWNAMMQSWSRYGLSASMAPTITRQQAEALAEKTLDEAADAIKTVGDCMYYYCASMFGAKGHDLQLHVNNDFFWHYNYAPHMVFDHNYGCCGSISGLTAYLLEGDYATTGIVGMTFAVGEGGGHVVNYIYDGARYYIFDMINWITSYYGRNLNLVSGDTLAAAAGNWQQASVWTEKLMYAYVAFDGDAPVGWEWETSYISYLPAQYRDSAQILLETPAEGYVYRWVDVPADIWQRIDNERDGR